MGYIKIILKVFSIGLFVTIFGCKSNKIENRSKDVYNIATYNLRYENNTDNKIGHSWKERKTPIINLIQKYDFDIVGVQEPFSNQIKDLAIRLKEYSNFGVSDDNKLNSRSNHHHDIFYKKTKFILVKKGRFWLSPGAPNSPPDDLMKAAWGGKAKVCIWGKFKDKRTSKNFYVFNTHFYFASETTRINSSKIILDKIKEIAGNSPVIFMGDLNFNQYSEAYNILVNSKLLEDSYKLADSLVPLNDVNRHQTFNHWLLNPQEGEKSGNRIDYIFLTNHWKNKVKSSKVIWDNYIKDGIMKMPSDHNPVMVKLSKL